MTKGFISLLIFELILTVFFSFCIWCFPSPRSLRICFIIFFVLFQFADFYSDYHKMKKNKDSD